MINNKNSRSYEVSIWTLQDSFISILKSSNLEQNGCIEEPEMVLKDDGENTFSFKIPMYIQQNGKYIENPLWYNVTNGVLIANLRKIKVIFNKGSELENTEAVFEFLITKVKESHEGFKKYCSVETEGLAFNELGKQGYAITLSGQDDVLVDFEEDETFENNLNYWVEKVLKGTRWKYSVQMDWSSYDGIIDDINTPYQKMTVEQRDALNESRENKGLRRRDKIYEDDYVSSWNYVNGEITSGEVTAQREKYRLIESSESNRYNLLQTIAETFQVYTKYVYSYDKNYHIIDREVIFYNNFLQEGEGYLDFTYKYDTSEISREKDSTDTITKMFVKDLNDTESPSGLTSISDTAANKSLENYLLNFDYLYSIGAISEEQYQAIEEFEKKVRHENEVIVKLTNKILDIEMRLPELKAKRDTLGGNEDTGSTGVIQECTENIEEAQAYLQELTNSNGAITIDENNPKALFLAKEDNKYYAKAPFGGINPETLKIYREPQCETEITSYTLEEDSAGNLKKINNLPAPINSEISYYATFDYTPKLEYERIINQYSLRRRRAKKEYKSLKKKINDLEKQLDGDKTKEENSLEYLGYKKRVENAMKRKAKILSDFENLMGPALREGTWQPEDEYVNYGDKKHKILVLKDDSLLNSNKEISIGWDEYKEDLEEDSNFYEYGASDATKYYPCIDLRALSANDHAIYSTLYWRIRNDENYLTNMSFIYINKSEQNISPENAANVRYWRYLTLGSGLEFAFLMKKTDDGLDNSEGVIPVLMFTEPNDYNFEKNIKNYSRLGIVEVDSNLNIGIKNNTEIVLYNSADGTPLANVWLKNLDQYTRVYPRIQINNKWLRISEDNLKIKMLNKFKSGEDPYEESDQQDEDYYIDLKENEDYYIINDVDSYYINFKSNDIIRFGKNIFTVIPSSGEDRNQKSGQQFSTDFVFSNTALAIYLDAIKIMKENAYPKTSYEISPSLIKEDFFYNAYNRLNQLIHINDSELKFRNVLGYISELNLQLDEPQEDKIVVKNYKTKFEDLFSTIVAQTESMKKNSYLVGLINNSFNETGGLSDQVLQDLLQRMPSTPINTYHAPVGPMVAYSTYSTQIREDLAGIFQDAGTVVNEVRNSVDDIENITITNRNLLTNFFNVVKEGYTISDNNQILFKVATTENGNTTSQSAISINKNGIYLGSTQPVTFFSGELDNNNSSASMRISSNEILFGVTAGTTDGNGTVAHLTKDYIIFGAGLINNGVVNTDVGSVDSSAAGIKIQQDSIKLATGSSNERNYISMDNNGVIIGRANAESDGSIVKISKDGVLIGVVPSDSSIKDVLMNVNNDYAGATFQVYAPNFIVDGNGHLYANDADITGIITASNGSIGGWSIDSNSIFKEAILGNNSENSPYPQKTYRIYISSGLYDEKYEGNGTPYNPVFCVREGTSINNYKYPFYVRSNGELHAENANITGTITTIGTFSIDNTSYQQKSLFSAGKIQLYTDTTANLGNGIHRFFTEITNSSFVMKGQGWTKEDDYVDIFNFSIKAQYNSNSPKIIMSKKMNGSESAIITSNLSTEETYSNIFHGASEEAYVATVANSLAKNGYLTSKTNNKYRILVTTNNYPAIEDWKLNANDTTDFYDRILLIHIPGGNNTWVNDSGYQKKECTISWWKKDLQSKDE